MDNLLKKNQYFLLFLSIRKNELGVNEINSVEKLPNKNLISLYNKEIYNLDNFIIFIEFLKEFICVFCHKYKYEQLIEEMFVLYSNMLDEYYNNTDNVNLDKENFIENDGLNDQNLQNINNNNDNFYNLNKDYLESIPEY